MRTAAVVVASTRAAAGGYEDRSGRVAADWFDAHGYAVEGPYVVADGEDVRAQLQRLLVERERDERPSVVVTSGGTGLATEGYLPAQGAGTGISRMPGPAGFGSACRTRTSSAR